VNLWRAPTLWDAVGAELREYQQAGLAGLLTEDVVRFTTARALVAAGADPAGLHVEWPHPALKGARVDLVAGHDPPTALLEFKFPREPSETTGPRTMLLGHVLKDLYRLAVYPGDVDRLFVYVQTAGLRAYMIRAAKKYDLDLDRDRVNLAATNVAKLPPTAAQIIGPELAAHDVVARRIALVAVDDTLRLAVYAVDPIATAVSPNHTGAQPQAVLTGEHQRATVRTGARQEILDAVHAILTRSGNDTFTLADILDEMARRKSAYAESTIRTMVTSHMCTNAGYRTPSSHADLQRVDRATYRLALIERAWSDPPLDQHADNGPALVRAPRFYAKPERAIVPLRVGPRLASWMAADHPDQVRLEEYLAEMDDLLQPKIATTPDPLALRLDVAIPHHVPLLDQRDLDNYLFPLVARLTRTSGRRFVSVWASKRHAENSWAHVTQALPVPTPTNTERLWQVRTTAASETTEYKQQIHDQLHGIATLPDGPVALQVNFAIGPSRNWANLWKPTIDALGTLLGWATPRRSWHPRDGRVIELGLHGHVEHPLRNDTLIAITASTLLTAIDETGPIVP
jgi:hypothetical protein